MQTPSTPLDNLWQPQAMIAIVLAGEALALILALPLPGTDQFWVNFGLASLMIQWICLTTLLVIYLLKHRLVRLPPIAIAWCCLALLLGMTCLVAWFGRELLFGSWVAGESGHADFIIRSMVIALVVGLLALTAFQNYHESKQQALRAKQAELEALQARVRPHFLFNTLNSVASLVHHRPDDAESTLLDLSDLFRAALAKPGWVPLAEEIDLCRRYLAIEQKRFGERLRADWQLPDDATNLFVPLLSIQPLLENAVTHGLESDSNDNGLAIQAIDTNDALEIVIRNPIASRRVNEHREGHGVGLSGVRARVESATGGTGKVATRSENGTYEASVWLPKASMPTDPDQAAIS